MSNRVQRLLRRLIAICAANQPFVLPSQPDSRLPVGPPGLVACVQRLNGPWGYAGVVLLTLTYVAVALEPFRWNPPRVVENGAELDSQGTLSFPEPGLVHGVDSDTWVPRAIARHRFQLALRIRSLAADQTGPARIFTVSRDPSFRNLTVGQERDALVVRLRTHSSDLGQERVYFVPRVFTTQHWHDVEVRVEHDEIGVSVDGRKRVCDALPDEPLRGWNASYGVGLGNELNGTRPWLGEIAKATVRCGHQSIDFLDDAHHDIPNRYWAGLKSQPVWPRPDYYRARDVVLDPLLNFACFIPYGFLLVLVHDGASAGKFAVGFCMAISLGIEASQLCFDDRMPSLLDWVANSAGGIVGAFVALRYVVLIQPNRHAVVDATPTSSTLSRARRS